MVETAKIIWADGPTGTPKEPDKAQIRAWGSWLENLTAALNLSVTATYIRGTKAQLDAVTGATAGQVGIVVADDDVSLRGVYVRQGSSWVRKLDLPADAAQAAADVAEGARDIAIDARDIALAAQEAAEDARDIAAGYASDAVSQGNVPVYATKAGMSALTVPPGINAVRVNGQAAAGDGLGGLYIDTNNGSADTFTSNGGTRTWYLAADVSEKRLRPSSVSVPKLGTDVLARLPGFWSDVLSHPDWFGGAQGLPAVIRLGEGAGVNIPEFSTYATDVILLGPGAGNAMTSGNNIIAIGGNVMSQGQPGSHSIGIGNSSLTYLDKTGGGFNGTRNVAVGSLTGHFTTTGYMNTYIGRNAGQCLTTGNNNTVGGYRAGGAGKGPIGLSGRIENQYPITANRMTAWGASCLEVSMGLGNTGLGAFAGQFLKSGSLNVLVGTGAGGNLDYDLSEDGKVLTRPAIAGTYSQSGTTITITAAANGTVVGNKVAISFTSGQLNSDTSDQQWLTVVTKADANTFTVASTVSKAASGSVTVDIVETAATRTASGTNTIVGVDAGNASQKMQGTTLMGWQAGYSSEGSDNTFIGQRAGYNNTTGSTNTALGNNAGRGASITTFSNWTALGANAVVTGSNQVQLGDSATTTYVYGTVQNRSDERDKADIRDTILGLELIEALRPRDWRFDYRSDYVTIGDETGEAIHHKRDGSKKRGRFHHGLIAQEVKAAMDKLGVDFGGYQDHSLSGGEDVLSIGYDELIGPLIKAVQELSARVRELERQ